MGTCPRRGRYIPRICIAGTTVFANKFAPTRGCVQPADAVLGPHQLPASVRKTWGRTCPRRGRYIPRIGIAGTTVFANKFPTGGCVQPADAVLGPHQLPASVRRTWDRTCPRRGRYIPRICIAGTTVFANKFAPTGGCVQAVDAVLGPHQLPASVRRTWDRTCPRRGRYIPRIGIAGTTVFANKFAQGVAFSLPMQFWGRFAAHRSRRNFLKLLPLRAEARSSGSSRLACTMSPQKTRPDDQRLQPATSTLIASRRSAAFSSIARPCSR